MYISNIKELQFLTTFITKLYFRAYVVDIFENTTNSDWTHKYKPDTGRCHSYRAPEHLRLAKIKTIKAFLNMPIEIYLHHPGQFCTWNIYVFTTPQKQVYVDVSHEVIIRFRLNY